MSDDELFAKLEAAGCFGFSTTTVADDEAEMVKQGLLAWMEDSGEDSDTACTLAMGWTGGDELLCRCVEAEGVWAVVWYYGE